MGPEDIHGERQPPVTASAPPEPADPSKKSGVAGEPVVRERPPTTSATRAKDPRPIRLARAIGAALAGLAAAIAVLGPVSFALLHAVYAQFYEPFNLAPEDVGLDAARVLATSIAGFGFALGAWTLTWLTIFGVPAASVVLVGPTRDPYVPRHGTALAGSIIVTLFLVAVEAQAALDVSSTGLLGWDYKIFAWLPVVIPVGAFVISVLRDPEVGEIRRSLKTPLARRIAAAGSVVLAVVFAAGTLVADASTIGRSLATKVQSGHVVANPTLRLPAGVARVRAFDIQADVADVQWLGHRARAVGAADCIMYLGSSGGIAILWNVSSKPQELLRVPQSTVVISTSGVTDCSHRRAP